MIIALTGGIGSGKSTAADYFAKLGVPLVDVDAISHELTSQPGVVMDAIAQQFGAAFVQANGSLNRAKMRETIFNAPAAKQQLEAILHPAIFSRASTKIEALKQTQPPYLMLVIPLFFESQHYAGIVNRVLVIDANANTQLQRVLQRPGMTPDLAEKIIASQLAAESRRALADDVIENNDDLQALQQAVANQHAQYLQLVQTAE